MGGKHEETIEQSTVTDIPGQNIRVHESKGQVHFHADQDNLKVSVSSFTWWNAWERLQQNRYLWVYLDLENMTQLRVFLDSDYGTDNKLHLNTRLYITKIAGISPSFEALNRFTTAMHK
jgi:hypothetical protein